MGDPPQLFQTVASCTAFRKLSCRHLKAGGVSGTGSVCSRFQEGSNEPAVETGCWGSAARKTSGLVCMRRLPPFARQTARWLRLKVWGEVGWLCLLALLRLSRQVLLSQLLPHPPEGLGGVGQVVVVCDHLSGTLDTYAYGQHTAAHSESVITCGSTPQKLGRESDLRSAPVA